MGKAAICISKYAFQIKIAEMKENREKWMSQDCCEDVNDDIKQ